jgi:hypothetical protein
MLRPGGVSERGWEAQGSDEPAALKRDNRQASDIFVA